MGIAGFSPDGRPGLNAANCLTIKCNGVQGGMGGNGAEGRKRLVWADLLSLQDTGAATDRELGRISRSVVPTSGPRFASFDVRAMASHVRATLSETHRRHGLRVGTGFPRCLLAHHFGMLTRPNDVSRHGSAGAGAVRSVPSLDGEQGRMPDRKHQRDASDPPAAQAPCRA